MDKTSLTRSSMAGVLWIAGGRGVGAGLQLLVLVVLARLLGPADFGVLSAALVIIGFSTIFAHFGFGPAVVQRKDLENRHVDTAFTVSIVIGVAFGCVIAATAPLAAMFFRMPDLVPVLRCLALVFPLQGLAVVADSLIRRDLRFRWLSRLDVIAYGVGYGAIGVSLAYLGLGVWSLVIAELSRVLVRTGMLLHGQTRRARPGWDSAAFHDLLHFGGGFTIARLANFLAVQGDNLVVGRTLGPAALGIYGRAYQLMAAPAASFGDVLDTVLFPAMAKVQNDKTRLAPAYLRAVSVIAAVMLPPSVAIVVLGPEIIRVALGSQWEAAIVPFQLLAVGMLFRTSYKMSDSVSRATGAVYRRAWRQVVYAALVICGAWVGQLWGIPGVAVAVVVALGVNFGLMAHLSLSVTGLSWREFIAVHIPPMALAATCVPVVWGVAEAMRSASMPPLVVLVGAGMVTASWAIFLIWRAPQLFLGQHVMWLLDTLRSYLPASLARSGKTPTAAPSMEVP